MDESTFVVRGPFECLSSRTPATSSGRIGVITDEAIERLVRCFYVKVRGDAELAPMFEAVIAPDHWEPHMALMRDFWSSIVLGTARYKGNPLAAHARIPNLRPEMFETWLRLFRETADEIFDREIAALICEKAGRIAQSFQLGLFYRPELDAEAAAERP